MLGRTYRQCVYSIVAHSQISRLASKPTFATNSRPFSTIISMDYLGTKSRHRG